ncbi:hypothetical protein COCC4DRAFT_134471 [Bipolaris maydis ATCC 48331]|uniref:Uncharacterized protein n=2 Tax=Cochliobolus heterostrophus TaxID=5016 RepID=M2UI02_COCH5|nr:uncharacterized protein COCC4DRAFT_134471 [Bipolaris maydis ATCC 48331]EMD87572.1 hypothetical protein COCHEDRAFT_1159846 [Bipolaris maydis C5]KAJ6212031.1 hypothetical protein PSV09DRAFT_1159846 [Bipolaris maydis]ENI06772.1 hypothetical protein COCC4DRAFT_134471 [Bipolaris maydis ATCC 48331]KAJ6267052.1 hypothetical protein PSV08DRAFT_251106 [Bipolaris maydis]KAJ6277670.1 hypothetical protein J3E71DRAFT_244725 [Bipolaris maydis]
MEPHQIRNRRPFLDSEGPPVPPKPYASNTPSTTHHRLAAVTWAHQDATSKPLPPVPGRRPSRGAVRRVESKPLPRPPQSSTLQSTFLWILGFAVWFLVIVILLPVITEKDAMPGLNRRLRNWVA